MEAEYVGFRFGEMDYKKNANQAGSVEPLGDDGQ